MPLNLLRLFHCPTWASRRLLEFLTVSAVLMLTPAPGFAQAPSETLPKPAKTPAKAAVVALPASFQSLDWHSLTPAQHNALKPLAASWATLSDLQKRKWITLSSNYPLMPATEQAKLHERMVQWAALTPRQREQARLNFAETKQIPPQQKSEKWQAYQALSAEEKQKLARSAQPKPPRTALAAQPVASDKISRMPMKKNASGVALPAIAPSLSKNTLLVKPKPPTPPTLPQAPAPAITHGATSQ